MMLFVKSTPVRSARLKRVPLRFCPEKFQSFRLLLASIIPVKSLDERDVVEVGVCEIGARKRGVDERSIGQICRGEI